LLILFFLSSCGSRNEREIRDEAYNSWRCAGECVSSFNEAAARGRIVSKKVLYRARMVVFSVNFSE